MEMEGGKEAKSLENPASALDVSSCSGTISTTLSEVMSGNSLTRSKLQIAGASVLNWWNCSGVSPSEVSARDVLQRVGVESLQHLGSPLTVLRLHSSLQVWHCVL